MESNKFIIYVGISLHRESSDALIWVENVLKTERHF